MYLTKIYFRLNYSTENDGYLEDTEEPESNLGSLKSFSSCLNQ